MVSAAAEPAESQVSDATRTQVAIRMLYFLGAGAALEQWIGLAISSAFTKF